MGGLEGFRGPRRASGGLSILREHQRALESNLSLREPQEALRRPRKPGKAKEDLNEALQGFTGEDRRT